MASSSSELAFKNLSESVRTSLQMFNALCAIPSSGVVSSPLCLALNELVNAAVCKSFNFFQETDSLAVYKLSPAFITTRPILDTLSSKNWHRLPILLLTSFSKNLRILKVLLRPSFLPA